MEWKWSGSGVEAEWKRSGSGVEVEWKQSRVEGSRVERSGVERSRVERSRVECAVEWKNELMYSYIRTDRRRNDTLRF